jgi:FAD/FMN-containing dehydrogenase
VLLDHPQGAPAGRDPWGRAPQPRTLELMRQLKARFDPAQICNPGVFVGGI